MYRKFDVMENLFFSHSTFFFKELNIAKGSPLLPLPAPVSIGSPLGMSSAGDSSCTEQLMGF
jgi:hypothetical protein